MTAATGDRFSALRVVADAVLNEGRVLYPYRASSPKNQMRWQFGVLAPQAYEEAGGSLPSSLQTECVVEVTPDSVLTVRVRFLRIRSRAVEAITRNDEGEDRFDPVASLVVDGSPVVAWDESEDCEVEVVRASCAALRVGATVPLSRPADVTIDAVVDANGAVAGRTVRRREALTADVRARLEPVDGPWPLARLSVDVVNTTAWGFAGAAHDEVVRHSLVATHVLAALDHGRFLSMVDPPEFARAAVESCRNEGAWPVPVQGEGGVDDLMLASAIILPDHPSVAPESVNEFCDATEIDEILTLRVMTLSDEEKREVRATDDRAAAILDRCDTMPEEIFARLHGAVRSLRPVAPHAGREPSEPDTWTEAGRQAAGSASAEAPWWDPSSDAAVDPWTDAVSIGDIAVRRGMPVLLRPGSRRTDAQDLFVTGRTATVAGIFRDVDGEVHIGVTLDDDPGADLAEAQGRFLYFRPDEVEPLGTLDPLGDRR